MFVKEVIPTFLHTRDIGTKLFVHGVKRVHSLLFYHIHTSQRLLKSLAKKFYFFRKELQVEPLQLRPSHYIGKNVTNCLICSDNLLFPKLDTAEILT